MRSLFSKSIDTICFRCGAEYEVVYSSLFKEYTRKVKYCPYCGHPFATSAKDNIIEFDREETKS